MMFAKAYQSLRAAQPSEVARPDRPAYGWAVVARGINDPGGAMELTPGVAAAGRGSRRCR